MEGVRWRKRDGTRDRRNRVHYRKKGVRVGDQEDTDRCGYKQREDSGMEGVRWRKSDRTRYWRNRVHYRKKGV